MSGAEFDMLRMKNLPKHTPRQREEHASPQQPEPEAHWHPPENRRSAADSQAEINQIADARSKRKETAFRSTFLKRDAQRGDVHMPKSAQSEIARRNPLNAGE
jgi:hypothetical protein